MKEKIVKVGIIGCGRIAGHHCTSIQEIDGIELVAVCDLELEKADKYGKQYNCPSYDNYHTMIKENSEINTIVIATPSGMHYLHAKDILSRYKKNLIIEKPTFMKPKHVEEIYQLAESYHVQIFSIFQNRYNAAVQRVLEGIRNSELGKIRTISVRVRWCRPQRYYDLSPWRGTYSMDGGCLSNQGIHHIDLMRYLGGEVLRVSSIHRTIGAEIEVEDTAMAILEFENGAVGNLEITTAARPDDFEASISFVCEKGLAQIGGIAVNELQVYSPNPNILREFSEDFSNNVYGNGHRKIYRDIFAALANSKPYPISFKDTLATVKLLTSFYQSNAKKGWVNLLENIEFGLLGQEDLDLINLYTTREK